MKFEEKNKNYVNNFGIKVESLDLYGSESYERVRCHDDCRQLVSPTVIY